MRRLLLWAMAATLAVGCSSDDAQRPSLSEAELAELPAVDAPGLKALLAQQHGKTAVLAIWSVRDPACVEMYKGLSPLARATRVVVAVNIDQPDDVRAKALPILRQHGQGLLNRHLDGDPMLLDTGDDTWAGLLPAVWVYGRDGKLRSKACGKGALKRAKLGR
jgi:hypothetical protein